MVKRLCDWFESEQRLLPWRQDPTPYKVWISEIMLQQTRIEAVLSYYRRFMEVCPTIEALAAISDDRLMKLWEGLGYYSRARHLKRAACRIMECHGGQLPADFEALKALPGIGEYTAGAIASIAFHISVPAVDGNVLRVLARVTACEENVMAGPTRRRLTTLAARLVPADRPDVFNQALMELGERVCLPNTIPHCERCPIRGQCAVAGTDKAALLPIRAAKKPRRIEKKTVLVILTDEAVPRVLLHKREDTGLLAGLWELPLLEGHETPALPVEGLTQVSGWLELTESKHIFSHIEWHMKGMLTRVKPSSLADRYEFVDREALASHRALPTAFRAYSQMLPVWLDPERK